MNVFNHFRDIVATELKSMAAAGDLPDGLDLTRVTAEPPRDPSHGDIATNAAMLLAKPAGRKPRELAEALAARLATLPGVVGVEVAGPGFINLRLADAFWLDRLRDVLRAGRAYGDSDVGAGRTVNVEYVSANPTGPLHVGHGRGAVFGDALASLLRKTGYSVVKEYYINDAGAQIDILARSAHLRYREALGEAIGEVPDGLYPGSYLKAVGAALAAEHGNALRDRPEEEWLDPVRSAAVAAMMALIREDLAALGIAHDVFTSERRLVADGRVDEALRELERRDLVYVGVLEPPKGKLPEDWEERPQTLFRATAFGDDVDRPLRKSDGSWTYFASDIAYHLDKWRRGEPVLIDVWGADHGGYVKRVQAAVKALTDGKGDLDVKLCQLVRITRGGETVRMSKREGSFISLREVIDEVGRDVVRFIMLTRKNDAPLDFDLVKVTEQSRDNPVFYVQYAHARARSVLRSAADTFGADAVTGPALADGPLDLLSDPDEIALIRLLAAWPRLVEAAAEAHEPHRIAFYLHDLTSAFHAFWTRGKDEARLRFIIEAEPDTTRARLALVQAVATVIASGLDVFGVEPVESM
jgi:arginyl-tRNA synthetase